MKNTLTQKQGMKNTLTQKQGLQLRMIAKARAKKRLQYDLLNVIHDLVDELTYISDKRTIKEDRIEKLIDGAMAVVMEVES